MLLNRLLVVVDPYLIGPQAVVDKAARLATSYGAILELMACDAEDHRPPIGAARPSDEELLQLVCGLAGPPRARGLEVKIRTVRGKSLRECLLAHLRAFPAQLVLKATHSHSLVRRTVFKNTDVQLVRACSVPLLLTKARPWPGAPVIMAALNAREESRDATILAHSIMRAAVGLTGYLTGELHVLHTYVPTSLGPAAVSRHLNLARESEDALRVEDDYRHGHFEALSAEYGVSPERVHVEMGDSSWRLGRAARSWHTDIMVMGAFSTAT